MSEYAPWIQAALDTGFSHAAELDAATLRPLDEVREMCAADKCRQYGKCWTCPPACGTVAENAAQMARYKTGLIVQTTGQLEDDFDIETIEETSRLHQEYFVALYQRLKPQFPGMLALGAGACTLCPTLGQGDCTCPDEPCRYPGDALSSMEAYGLLVSEVCTLNHLKYYYGPQTLTFTGCYLLE